MIEIINQYKVLIAVLSAAIISQLAKIILNSMRDKKGISIKDLIVTGGMPSTHSSLVSSLFSILIINQGFTPLTVLSMVLFIIVVTDSMGVRRTAGEEGKVLNKIIRSERLDIKQFNYSLGHKPIEVFAGILIGIAVSLVIVFL